MKITTIILSMLLIVNSTFSQDITGTWNGNLQVQSIRLRLVFHLSKSGEGYAATMDSPDQNAKGIPVSQVNFTDSVLSLRIPVAGIDYQGTFITNDSIAGTFKQTGQSFPLNLVRGEGDEKTGLRPQEPRPPFAYFTEDVSFENKTAGIHLAGTFTWPKGKGLFPAVVLISGSGPQDRNEEIFGHKPFLVLADDLTRQGIAVLRFDDRGTGQSEGTFATATTLDFAADVKAAVRYLKERPEIDTSKIGLIGHSEGGLIAPLVATEVNEISYLVLLAAPGLRSDTLLLLQQQAIGKASGLDSAKMNSANRINKGAYKLIRESAGDPDRLNARLTAYFDEISRTNPAQLYPPGSDGKKITATLVNQLTTPWMITFLKFDPRVILTKVKCPVLAINGEKDLQVLPGANLEAIQQSLEEGKNKDVTCRELSGLNHLFQECTSGLPSEYGQITQTFSPRALQIIGDWVRSHTNP